MPLPRSRRDALAEQYPRLAPRIHGADREEAAPTIAMLILALLGQGPSAAAAEGALEAVEAVEVAEEGAVVARSLTPAPAATGTPRAPGASGPSVQANQATGNAFRDEVAEALQNAGRVVEKEVYKETWSARPSSPLRWTRGRHAIRACVCRTTCGRS